MVVSDFDFRKTEFIEITDHVATGKAFRQFRESLGLTQQQVADHWGINKRYLQRLENGHNSWTERSLIEGPTDAFRTRSKGRQEMSSEVSPETLTLIRRCWRHRMPGYAIAERCGIPSDSRV